MREWWGKEKWKC